MSGKKYESVVAKFLRFKTDRYFLGFELFREFGLSSLVGMVNRACAFSLGTAYQLPLQEQGNTGVLRHGSVVTALSVSPVPRSADALKNLALRAGPHIHWT